MAKDTDPQTEAEATILASPSRWRGTAADQPMPPAPDATRPAPGSAFPFPRPQPAFEPRRRPAERPDTGRKLVSAPPSAVFPAQGRDDSAFKAALEVYQDNPGLALAVPILELLVRAQQQASGDADALHDVLVAELQTFETQALARGLSHQHARLILYAIAATADDCVLHTQWGNESNWAARTLVSELFQETWGGERFFSLLKQMMAAPHAVVREIEFYYFCLQFGFEGKYRLAANGAGELTRLKEDVFQFLRSVRGGIKSELSPNWRGVAAESRGPRDFLPMLFHGIGIAVLLLVIFIGFSLYLRRQSTLAVQDVQSLMSEPIFIKQATLAPPPDAAPPAPAAPTAVPAAPAVPVATRVPAAQPAPAPPAETPLQVISGFLAPEQKARLLTVFARNSAVVIQTQQELFASASTGLRAPYPDVMTKVAAALAKFKGPIQVFGYTDNVPINSMTFPNNLALSTARARAVGDTLARALGSNVRITTFGKGDADPVASNDTAEGRQQNRRVEIILTPQ